MGVNPAHDHHMSTTLQATHNVGEVLTDAIDLARIPVGTILRDNMGAAIQLGMDQRGDVKFMQVGTGHTQDAANLIRSRSFGGRTPTFTIIWLPEA